MTTDDLVELLISMGAGLLGGLVVAVINQLFTRKKTHAETMKLNAEADKIRAETQKLFGEMQKVASTVQEASYRLSPANETLIYDGRPGVDGADFSGQGERLHGEPKERPKGTGALRIEGGALNIQRTNTAGRFRLTLLRYTYGHVAREYIPKNDLIAGKRVFRLTCEGKAVGGSHTAVFAVKSKRDGSRLASHEQTFSRNEWEPAEAYLRVAPNEDCYLIVDDQAVSQSNSSLQLRALVLAEKAS
jgi:hypothetical protein